MRIGVLHKQRGNYALQMRFAGQDGVTDTTSEEVAHHRQALVNAGHSVEIVPWRSDIITRLSQMTAHLVFNVSSMAEAALLEDLEIPFVGSDSTAIAIARDKSLAKKLWRSAGLPTAPFVVMASMADCEAFCADPQLSYPLFAKPVRGRGSAGIDSHSVIGSDKTLRDQVQRCLNALKQPVLVEPYLRGREITLGVVGNGSGARVLPPLEIRYREGDRALTFGKKERDDDEFLCPAPLERTLLEQMQRLALEAYHVVGLKDYGRIDTILTAQGPMLLEANSFAGLMCTPAEKPHSYIGHMVRAEGRSGQDLLGEITEYSARRLGLYQRNGEANAAS